MEARSTLGYRASSTGSSDSHNLLWRSACGEEDADENLGGEKGRGVPGRGGGSAQHCSLQGKGGGTAQGTSEESYDLAISEPLACQPYTLKRL